PPTPPPTPSSAPKNECYGPTTQQSGVRSAKSPLSHPLSPPLSKRSCDIRVRQSLFTFFLEHPAVLSLTAETTKGKNLQPSGYLLEPSTSSHPHQTSHCFVPQSEPRICHRSRTASCSGPGACGYKEPSSPRPIAGAAAT